MHRVKDCSFAMGHNRTYKAWLGIPIRPTDNPGISTNISQRLNVLQHHSARPGRYLATLLHKYASEKSRTFAGSWLQPRHLGNKATVTDDGD